jgi:hypothetical protein
MSYECLVTSLIVNLNNNNFYEIQSRGRNEVGTFKLSQVCEWAISSGG